MPQQNMNPIATAADAAASAASATLAKAGGATVAAGGVLSGDSIAMYGGLIIAAMSWCTQAFFALRRDLREREAAEMARRAAQQDGQ